MVNKWTKITPNEQVKRDIFQSSPCSAQVLFIKVLHCAPAWLISSGKVRESELMEVLRSPTSDMQERSLPTYTAPERYLQIEGM